jgi:hypothetical protein
VSNFGRTFAAWASERTNAPVAFHEFAALAVCAAALGNRLWVDAGWGRIYPHLWVCLTGRSRSRKTTVVNLAASLLARADESVELPHDFTREALYDQLAARPWGLLRWREMGSVLKAMKREYNAGTLETLTDFWDSPATTKRRTKSSGEILITRPSITILAAAKERWFVENIRREDIEGGFMSRWLFVSSDEVNGAGRFFGNPRTSAEHYQEESMVDHLRGLTQQPEGGIEPGEGGAMLETWITQWEARGWTEDTDPADFAQRAGAQVTKLAIALMAARGEIGSGIRDIDRHAAESAIALYEESFRCGQHLVEQLRPNSPRSEEMERVRAIVAKEKRITRRELLRRVKMQLRDVEPIIETLRAGGWVKVEESDSPAGGGPKSVFYKWSG